jgi:2-polyprenyl-6-methoxyphenol hydroxylase-like FAD-dependent oxidoreductase
VSFQQHDDHVLAKLVKKLDGKEVSETFEASYLIGADGGKGMFSPLILRISVDHLLQVSAVNNLD